ncbi:ubiquitin thioesterase OTUB1-like [Acanthaster planci]|uniref:Ubiquitin thioesterase n=1 Tax=Acanthaster planci TaxID=133434 RepID=A0A8B7YZ05_ACAPL|nr:ubiquitin thioesterase OTUB1-like [Acanthaster planci]
MDENQIQPDASGVADQDTEELTGMAREEAIIAQQERIQNEIKENCPLVSDRYPISVLFDEYLDDAVYKAKIEDLSMQYSHIRKTRGDGNCFFRAFGFAYLERLLTDKKELKRLKTAAEMSKDQLVSLGFPSFTITDFHETFMEVIQQVEQQPEVDELVDTFRDQGISDYIVVYLRLLTSGQLQQNAEFYENFIEGGRTVKEFCRREVEPMARESDHIHIIALTSALDVGVRVVYLDRGEGGKVIPHDFPDGCSPQVVLLYRPGHYDVLYPLKGS